MSWNEQQGRVSRAFNDWWLTERDQRVFLRLGLQFAHDAYERLWKEAGEEPYDEETGYDQVDSFEEKVDGLWDHDYTWMHLAAVLRDAVTSFEVYLEKAREEVLERHGHPRIVPEKAPEWKKIRSFFRELGVDVEPPDVRRIRTLRHVLTHRRGELRTDSQRKEYAAADDRWAIVATLSESQVLSAMDDLAAVVRIVDAPVWEHSWGGARIPSLRPTSAISPTP